MLGVLAITGLAQLWMVYLTALFTGLATAVDNLKHGDYLNPTPRYVTAAIGLGLLALIWYGYWICRSDPNRLPKGQALLTVRSQESDLSRGTREVSSQERRGGPRQRSRRVRGGRGRRI